jgi:hypothetical protein
VSSTIKAQRIKLETEIDQLFAIIKGKREALRELREGCLHPNGVHGKIEGYPAFGCPDCGLSYMKDEKDV